jgi:hypothetical protein
LRTIGAKQHELYNIHSNLQVDVVELIKMIDSPDPPNAAQWIPSTPVFTLETEHSPAGKHKPSVGLPRRPRANESSDFNKEEPTVDDGMKPLRLIGLDDFSCRTSMAEHRTEEAEYDEDNPVKPDSRGEKANTHL